MPDTPAPAWQEPATELRDPEPGDAADRAAQTDELMGAQGHESDGEPAHDDIARAAYALYEARGGEEGRSEEDWFNAEQQLRHERHDRRA